MEFRLAAMFHVSASSFAHISDIFSLYGELEIQLYCFRCYIFSAGTL